MKKIIVIIFLACFQFVIGQKLKEVDINFMLRGDKYVSSSIVDTTALGGYAKSDNIARPITSRDLFQEKGLILKIDTTQNVSIRNEYKAYKLYLANTSDSIVELLASDSRISIVAQAWIDKKWQNIEYLPSSSCGNSFHEVYLKPNEYWEFTIPKFKGKIKTKIRYRLILRKNEFIDSNEISAGINRKQLTEKRGYQNQGIMDPYFD